MHTVTTEKKKNLTLTYDGTAKADVLLLLLEVLLRRILCYVDSDGVFTFTQAHGKGHTKSITSINNNIHTYNTT